MSDLQMNNPTYPVLRAIQLDSAELDQTLIINLKQIFYNDFFKYCNNDLLQEYNQELYLIFNFLIWYFLKLS
jgi:hypothetical protein